MLLCYKPQYKNQQFLLKTIIVNTTAFTNIQVTRTKHLALQVECTVDIYLPTLMHYV